MGGLGIQPVEAAHSFMSLLKVTEESTVAVCVHVSMEEVGTKPASLSANRRDGEGAHRMDVSSSLITVERSLWEGCWLGQRLCQKRGRRDFIRKVKNKTENKPHRTL